VVELKNVLCPFVLYNEIDLRIKKSPLVHLLGCGVVLALTFRGLYTNLFMLTGT
jgi:hypothetical protein